MSPGLHQAVKTIELLKPRPIDQRFQSCFNFTGDSNSGRGLSDDMERPMKLEEEFMTCICQGMRAHHACRATWGSTRLGQEGGVAFIVVSLGKTSRGRRNSVGLAISNNFGGLWAIGVVCSCLVQYFLCPG